MSRKSKEAYHENRGKHFDSDYEKVLDLIKNNPRITGVHMQRYMKKDFSKFSGRLTELRRDGLVYILEGEGKYSQYVYEPDVERQAELRGIYKREKDLARIESFMARFADRLTASGKAAIRAMKEMIEAELTETEKRDLLTKGLIN